MFSTDHCSAGSSGIESPDSTFGAGNKFKLVSGINCCFFISLFIESVHFNLEWKIMTKLNKCLRSRRDCGESN